MKELLNKKKKKYIHLILFLVTLVTTTLSGTWWIYGRNFLDPALTGQDVIDGLYFSVPFLLILSVHEFGHYFTAKYYNIDVTLPYFIPFFPLAFSIGTFGAVIRIKSKIESNTQNFDIGIAGPLAGFVAALLVLYYGFTHLPEKEHIYNIHPEYEYFGDDYELYVYDQDTFLLNQDLAKINPLAAQSYPDTIWFRKDGPKIYLGDNLLFKFFKNYAVQDKSKVPNKHEIMHYPWLLAGFLALFFTALNLMPVGQLDGGHVLYGLAGSKNHRLISSGVFLIFVFYAGLGVINPHDVTQDLTDLVLYIPLYIFFLYIIFFSFSKDAKNRLMIAVVVFALQFLTSYIYPEVQGYRGWLVFAFLLGRVLGVNHPPTLIEEPIGTNRQILGWIALVIFIISFSPQPLIIEGM